jgi:type IV pilus assembly protein PilB
MILPDELRDILTKTGFVAESDFNAALKSAEDMKLPITDVLVFRGLISDDALGKLIAEHYGVKFVNLRTRVIPLKILQTIPEQAAVQFHMVPFDFEGNNLHLGLENPQDIEALEFAKRKTNLNVIPYYISPADFAKSIGQYKRNIKGLFQDIIKQHASEASKNDVDISKIAEEIPVIKILDTIIEYASAEGASDIHLNVLEDSMIIRFRVDGILKDIATLPKNIHPAIIARVKIVSTLKIDEHRIPQDGRFKFKIHESYTSLRVSILPSFFGENVVMRLLSESSRPLSLEELGFSADEVPVIRDNIKRPHGMILVTGPTGSGKTTTLYSILNMLNTPEVNICTIEDPVEYSVNRINQTQVNTQAGLTFASGLRSLLRHDPDVIMIGEIRDNETAEIAIHSALTGHLVLTTLHTNSASGAIPRFLDMGVQAFLLASTVNVIIAQRLVRRICTVCIHRVEPTSEMLEVAKQKAGANFQVSDFFSGQGCNECDGNGYKGRVGIYEIIQISPEMRDLITQKVPADEIMTLAKKQGAESLMQDGLNKVSAGITTLEEVIRVTTI